MTTRKYSNLTGTLRRPSGRTPARFAGALAFAMGALLAGGAAQAQEPSRWIEGELIVGLRAGIGPVGRAALFRDHGASFVEDIGRNARVVRIRVSAPLLEALKRRMERRHEVKFIEKNYVFEPAMLPNDLQYANQWHLPKILSPQAWDLTQGAPGAVIAILDSGIDATHPDFAGKLLTGYNTYSNSIDTSDQFGHGTEVAGVAGALTNNSVGIAGVAGNAPMMPIRVTDATGRATSASIANGIVWAADHGARIVNLSFNGIAGNATIRASAEYAYNHGTLVVAASGNCGCLDPTPENPYILSVSATDETDNVAYFSSTGAFVDLSAPGTNISTTAMFGLYAADSGTSLASPIVAGVAALMFSANPALTPGLVTQLLESTAFGLGAGISDPGFGHGRVDAFAAVSAAAGYVAPPDTTNPTVAMTTPANGSSVAGTAVVDVSANDNVGVVKVDLYVDGAFFVTDTVSPYSFFWDTTVLPNGSHTLRAVATDAANNTASTAPIAVTVSNSPPDISPPAVSISAPAAGASVAGTTTVSANASDNTGVAKVELYVDGALYATDTASPYSFAWNTTQWVDGPHALKVVAADAAGNVTSAALTITVANKVNHAPVASNDSFTASYRQKASYTPQVFSVLVNDRDADGNLDAASVKILTAPNKGGTATVKANGTVAYSPKIGYRGTETFGYNVKDKLGASSNTAIVTVNVR